MKDDDRLIKVLIPTQEEIDKITALGVDIEGELVKAFRDELHMRLHPEDRERVLMS